MAESVPNPTLAGHMRRQRAIGTLESYWSNFPKRRVCLGRR
jgi:hypothetical protein